MAFKEQLQISSDPDTQEHKVKTELSLRLRNNKNMYMILQTFSLPQQYILS